MIKIKKGLDLPIEGEPRQEFGACPKVKTVAVVGLDFHGIKPTMKVKVGDKVKIGQELFCDKTFPDIVFTAPGAGRIREINRGAKRVLQSVVIDLDGKEEAVSFTATKKEQLDNLSSEAIRKQLLQSGMWQSFRTRPFSLIPEPDAVPGAIFINCMDTNPLAVYPPQVIERNKEHFRLGVQLISKLTEGPVYICHDRYTPLPEFTDAKIKTQEFAGIHPAGLPGTHIHFLSPVNEKKTVWHISYQDIFAVARLFIEGKLAVDRVLSLAGPLVKNPRLINCRLGASLEELCEEQLHAGEARLISGSVFSGRHGAGALAYLGRYDLQVSVIKEGRERELLGWKMPGFDKFSVKNTFFSKLIPGGKKFPFTTSTGGSERAMVPIGSYEKVMPLRVEPTFLLRSLLTQDIEEATKLGALELDEEDLGLCTFVCPGKEEYGPKLRSILNSIVKEG